MMHGARFLASLKRSLLGNKRLFCQKGTANLFHFIFAYRTRAAPRPPIISMNSDPFIDKNGTLASVATALASIVFPQPGGLRAEETNADVKYFRQLFVGKSVKLLR